MRTIAAFISLAMLALVPAGAFLRPAEAQFGPGARVWVENDREYFRHGDRLRVNFSTSANSYVAVVHIDPNGNLDFVYPRSPWDDDFVRGGRVYSLDRSGWGNGLLVRGGSGIGYLYVIASPVPLDYGRFRGGPGSHWDWSYAGRSVSGDPFWAMEQITRSLLPRWGNVPYAADYYTYFVGGRHRYPSYACANRYNGFGWGYSPAWSSYYGSCDRLDYFLRDNPYYFDSRRFRGDRRGYYRDYYDERDWDPRHAYKVDPSRPAARPDVRNQAQPSSGGASRVTPRPAEPTRPAARPAQRAEPRTAPAAAAPAREGTPRPEARPTPAAPRDGAAPRAQPAPRPESRREPAARPLEEGPSRTQPAPRPEARRAEPRPAPASRPVVRTREDPPSRAQPAPRPRAEPRSRDTPARAESGSRSPSSAASRSSGSSGGRSSTASPRSRRDN